jgi:ligand-binding sensor domain-containing protein
VAKTCWCCSLQNSGDISLFLQNNNLAVKTPFGLCPYMREGVRNTGNLFFRPCFLSLLAIQLSFCLHAQTFDARNYTVKDGLISEDVYNLFQDKQGYLWIFSDYGTLKYNGSEFTRVLKNLPFKESFIYRIYENRRGQKWVANSNARIYEVRNDSAFIIEGIEELSAQLRNSVSEIGKLFVDDSLTIYIATKGKSYKLVRKNHKYLIVDLSYMLPTDSIRIKLLEFGNDIVHINKRFKNDEFVKNNKKKIYLQPAKSNQLVEIPIFENKVLPGNFRKFKNRIYFARANFIGKINSSGVDFIKLKSIVLNFTVDDRGHIWAACYNGGLYEVNEDGSIINHFFGNVTVNDVLIDHQSGVWVSTNGSGLFRLENTSAQRFNDVESLRDPMPVITQIGNKLFIATKKGALFAMEKNSLVQIRNSFNCVPRQITGYDKGYILLSECGFERLDRSARHFSPEGPNGNVYNSFNAVAHGNNELIFTWRRGIILFEGNRVKKRLDFGCKITCSLVSGDTIWVGTENGIALYDLTKLKEDQVSEVILESQSETPDRPFYLADASDAIIRKIVRDSRNNLWFIAKGTGLYKLENNRLKFMNSDSGLPDNTINDLSFMDDGRMLLSCINGLFVSKNPVSGYRTWECIYPGSVQAAQAFENRIYASDKSGLLFFENSARPGPETRNYFNLAEIKVDFEKISPGNFKIIDYDQNILEFKFDFISFSETKPKMKYVLKGEQSDSGITDHPSIRFNLVTPGNYTLAAYPLVKNGEALKITIPFVIKAAFWQTMLFKTAGTILLTSIAVLLTYFIVRRRKRKEALKAKNEQLLLEYKLIALKAQINPHFISNCLSAIQHLIRSNATNEANTYIAKFGLLVRKILDFSSQPVVSMEEELKLLEIYLDLEQLRFKNKFSYSFTVEKKIALSDVYLPPLILNPIVENAIWHGLLPIESKRPAEMKLFIRQSSNTLTISIEDNGVGIDLNKMAAKRNNNKSYGLDVTEQRLTNLNYLYKRTEARLTYQMLVNEEGNPAGTLVTLVLPLILPQQND